MTSVERHADFVECVYDAILKPRGWNEVLERFADLLGGSKANLVDQDEIFQRFEPAGLVVEV